MRMKISLGELKTGIKRVPQEKKTIQKDVFEERQIQTEEGTYAEIERKGICPSILYTG